MRATASRLSSRLTLRLRLALLYGACFLVAGAALLGITYALFAQSQGTVASVKVGEPLKLPSMVLRPATIHTELAPRAVTARAVPVPTARPLATTVVRQLKRVRASDVRVAQAKVASVVRQANVVLRTQHAHSMSSLLLWSIVGLGAMALAAMLLGWLVAGRALAPLREMNQRARAITAENLHERLGLEGRRDELGELALTFDTLLSRLESAFEHQRCFVANASHELRTPLTLERALIEVALADPDADTESLRRVCERVLAAGAQQEQLIEALLTLARGQAGVAHAEDVDLSALAGALLEDRRDRIGAAGLELRDELAPASTVGDGRLLESLVANLIDNATVHNRTGGWLSVRTSQGSGGRPQLVVTNTGPVITSDEAGQLAEPFRRLSGERVGEGLGLGLSIVQAIAAAHGAELALTPRPEGGLRAAVSFATSATLNRDGEPAPRGGAFAVLRATFR